MTFHRNFIFLPSLKCGLLFIFFFRYFLKGGNSIKKWFGSESVYSAPLFTILLNLTFPSVSFLAWSLESCLKMRALVFTTKEFCWERDTAWIWNNEVFRIIDLNSWETLRIKIDCLQ